VALALTIFESIGGLDHGAQRPRAITFALALGWAVIAAALTWVVLGRTGSTMARRPRLVALAVLAAPFALFAWTHLFYGTYAEPFYRIGYRCLAYTLTFSALPLAAFLALKRAVEPRYPSVLGAGAGAACAAWAGGLVDLWCPLTSPLHVLVGHILPVLGAMLVGAAVGHFTLGVRRA
jgi:hypothetical protein